MKHKITKKNGKHTKKIHAECPCVPLVNPGGLSSEMQYWALGRGQKWVREKNIFLSSQHELQMVALSEGPMIGSNIKPIYVPQIVGSILSQVPTSSARRAYKTQYKTLQPIARHYPNSWDSCRNLK